MAAPAGRYVYRNVSAPTDKSQRGGICSANLIGDSGISISLNLRMRTPKNCPKFSYNYVSLINVAQTFEFAPDMPHPQSLCDNPCLWRVQMELATHPKCLTKLTFIILLKLHLA